MRSQEQIGFFSAVERLPRGVRKSMELKSRRLVLAPSPTSLSLHLGSL